MTDLPQAALVVFDMAGTTIYDGDAVHRSLLAALAGVGIDASRDEVNRVMGIAKPVAIRQLLQGCVDASLLDSKVNSAYDLFVEAMLDHYRTSPDVQPILGTEAVFHLLQNNGIRIALDTGFSRQIADTILDRIGWLRDGLVDFTITADEVPAGRPAPDMILSAMRRLGITDPLSVAKVGDTPADLEEGTAAGCGWVIGVTQGSHTADELKPSPHTHLIPSVRELPAILLGPHLSSAPPRPR